VSQAGGEQPRWRSDGRELFFVGMDGRMMAVAMMYLAGPKLTLRAATPRVLFETHLAKTPSDLLFQYDVTGDGRRFLLNTVINSSTTAPLKRRPGERVSGIIPFGYQLATDGRALLPATASRPSWCGFRRCGTQGAR